MSTLHSRLVFSLQELDTKLYSSTTKLPNNTNGLPSPSLAAKWQTFDLPSMGGSLNDLDDCCKLFLQRQDSCTNSVASTAVGSRLTLESRCLTRNLSLEAESLNGNDDDTKKSISSPEKPASFLRMDTIFTDCKETCHSIILEDESEAFDRTPMGKTPCAITSLQETLEKPKVEFEHIVPRFDTEGLCASSFTFKNQNRTITHRSNTRFTTIYAEEPLPTYGKVKFSVCIELSNKTHPKLYMGVASSEWKEKPIGYKPGFYFLSAFSSESYMNGLKKLTDEKLPRQDQVITVCLDFETNMISFEMEDRKLLEGRLVLPKTGAKEFYPCVSLGEQGGSVSFV